MPKSSSEYSFSYQVEMFETFPYTQINDNLCRGAVSDPPKIDVLSNFQMASKYRQQ